MGKIDKKDVHFYVELFTGDDRQPAAEFNHRRGGSTDLPEPTVYHRLILVRLTTDGEVLLTYPNQTVYHRLIIVRLTTDGEVLLTYPYQTVYHRLILVRLTTDS